MKVAVVVEQLRRSVPGGIGTYTRGLLRGLTALGDASPRVVLHASRPASAPDPLAAFGHPVVASRLPGGVLVRSWDRGIGRGRWNDSDVVHATSLAFPATTRPLSVVVHDLGWREVPDAYPRRGRRWHETAFARACRTASRLVVPSQPVADAIVRCGVPAATVEVIEEGCDHLPPADLDAADALLHRLGVREGFLLTVSTLEPRKNLDRLVAAFDRARAALAEPWPLVVVGPPGWGPSLGGREVPHGVVLAGAVDDATLAGLYRRARCLVYVPLAEGFGLPPVEAMRECTPVVASPVPSIGDAALVVDPLDVDSIARALVAASGDDRVRAELVTAGLLRAGELRWEQVAEHHVELWRSMA